MVVKNILLVEGDGLLRDTLGELLGLQKDFLITALGTGEAAVAKLKEENFDLLIMEEFLPDIDGRELCLRVRREKVKSPIVMLLGAETGSDPISSAQSEPNEYIAKPFRIGFLVARIQFYLRKLESDEAATYSLGRYKFHPATKILFEPIENKTIKLTEKETSILKYLLRPPNTLVGRAELLDEVWGYNSGVTTHTLETHVYRLRQKMKQDPSDSQILVTEPGGYRLIP
ncbi:MAG: DNA-binding response regulator [Legionellales bacterium]|nr:DNA-binding response regulator [Legionellales bacterium]